VLPGTLLHALHNASATLISYYSTRLAGAGLGQDPTTHLPTTWLIASAVLICVGLLCVAQGTGRDLAVDSNLHGLDDAVDPGDNPRV
jgi:hypothetical protein